MVKIVLCKTNAKSALLNNFFQKIRFLLKRIFIMELTLYVTYDIVLLSLVETLTIMPEVNYFYD